MIKAKRLNALAVSSPKRVGALPEVPTVAESGVPGLGTGDIGTVVMVHEAGAGYEVEFVALDGETLAVTTLVADQVRPINRQEIAHARRVAA